MKKLIPLIFLLPFYFQLNAQTSEKHKQNDYQQAWEALDKNNFTKAKALLLKASEDPQLCTDALSTLILLEGYLGKVGKIIKNYNNPILRMNDPENYFFAFWFNNACLGNYGKMDSAHLKNVNYILSHKDLFNGSMQAAAHYFKSFHEMMTWNRRQSKKESAKIGAIPNWEYTGPFDNIAGSGFNKNYSPIAHPQSDTLFKAYNNTTVKWFIPAHIENDSWIFVKPIFPETNGLIYAQSFVHSDEDKTCLLCLGGAGSLKVWVNDKLLLSESEEKVTELDTYKVVCHLKKGYNRVLVQLGFADTDLPNFILRFTDENYHPIPGLTSYASYHPYTKDVSTKKPVTIPLFAEEFFKEKIKKDPSNPINYLLLNQTYVRNQKGYQAQKLMSKLLSVHPKNILVLAEYMLSLQTESNFTETQENLEKIKSLDPDGFASLYAKEAKLEKAENYKDALDVLGKIVQKTGTDPQILLTRIKLVANQGNLSKLLTLANKGYREYPDNATFSLLLYNYYKKAANDPLKALKTLENYNNRLFNYGISTQLSNEYIEQGQFEKGIRVLKKLRQWHPENKDYYNIIANDYYNQSKLDSAIVYLKMLSKNGPYISQPYSDIATCYLEKKDTATAIKYLHKALDCNPSLSSLRKKIRELEKKPELFTYFPKINEDKEISDNLKHPYDSSHHFYYIFDIRNTLIYAEGASEQEFKTAIYLHDDKGIAKFHDSYVPYNNNFQELTILKAEVIKSNGSRIPAETNDNEMVFPKLEAGDVIYFHYKLRNYGIGRLGREFWDKFYFSTSVPTCIAQYNVLMRNDIPFYYKFSHGKTIKPEISTHENFKLYSWKMDHIPALKNEYLMPPAVDVGKVLQVSTIPSWKMISTWYSDLTREQSASSLGIEQLITDLFPKGVNGLNDMEKAKAIYNYIVSHISYSSVSFLQSAYVPQKASKTLITKLGDCKDMATLFVALARKAGLKANLVLVSTRDNGQQAMVLPSLEFNHCIVKFNVKGQNYYLELTDKNLPFCALPDNLYGAEVLNIPYKVKDQKAELTILKPVNKALDKMDRKISMAVSDNDIKVHSVLNVTGALSARYRDRYRNELKSDVNASLKQNLTQIYKKPVKIDSVKFIGVNRLSDSVQERIGFTVSNEVIEIGNMHVLKPNFMDVVANSNLFTVDKRKYPIEYWKYENAEQYKTAIEINLPSDRSFKEIPSNATFNFNQMIYHLSYQKISPHKLLIKRSFITQPWKNIQAEDYGGLEDFFHKIIKAESRYISF